MRSVLGRRCSGCAVIAASTAALFLGPGLSAGALAVPATDSGGSTSESAVWTPRQLTFLYQGFTARYSCDGLRDKMYAVLLQLGARKKDLKVSEYGCTNFSRPDPFPGVKINMSVLQPAGSAQAGNAAQKPASNGSAGHEKADAGDTQPVAAHWKQVTVRPDMLEGSTGSGDCELIEQIHDKVLPLFATRNVDYQTNCVPYQATVGGTTIKLEVLQPDAQKPAGTPPADQ